MKLNEKLSKLRKQKNYTQEEFAEKLGVTRQTISNWENGVTVLDSEMLINISELYNISVDDLLLCEDNYLEKVKRVIRQSDEKSDSKIDWSKAWATKYPVLATYQDRVDVKKYALKIRKLLDEISSEYGYDNLDSMLVLKDVLAKEWKDEISKK